MENVKLGGQTFRPGTPPMIIGHGSAAGSKECRGPLARGFDHTCKDDLFGEQSWEKAESRMQQLALDAALKRAGLHTGDLDLLLAGDLLNQCIGSSFAAREANVPYLGLYGACSTMGEGLALAALLLAGGWGRRAAAVTSSHFCSAERQYRTPLEYGGQRTPTAQWTATAAGAVILAAGGQKGPAVTCVTVGKIVDKGIKDANNMGAAMAPEDGKLAPCSGAKMTGSMRLLSVQKYVERRRIAYIFRLILSRANNTFERFSDENLNHRYDAALTLLNRYINVPESGKREIVTQKSLKGCAADGRRLFKKTEK